MADDPIFPWAREYDADQLAAFIDDLWGAASGDDDLATLDAVEKVIREHAPEPQPCPLTGRQIEILTEIANGETYEGVARNLDITVNNIRSRVPQICGRLGAKNATHAAVIAVGNGWLPGFVLPDPVEEPGKARGSHTWARIYQDSADELRRSPGLLREFGPYRARSAAHRASQRIRRGLFPAFAPEGAFAAQTRRIEGGRWAVVACYLGDATRPDTSPAQTGGHS